MQLYKIAQELATLHEQLDAAGGELTVELEASLDRVQMAFVEKAENIRNWIVNLEERQNAIALELNRLQIRAARTESLVTRLKAYLVETMIHGDVRTLDYDLFTLRVQKNPPSLLVTDQTKIPAAYLTVIPESYEPNRKKIMEAFKAMGERVEGTEVITDKHHLRIE